MTITVHVQTLAKSKYSTCRMSSYFQSHCPNHFILNGRCIFVDLIEQPILDRGIILTLELEQLDMIWVLLITITTMLRTWYWRGSSTNTAFSLFLQRELGETLVNIFGSVWHPCAHDCLHDTCSWSFQLHSSGSNTILKWKLTQRGLTKGSCIDMP